MKERNEATGHTQGTMSALTGSEFWIGTIRMPSGVNASLDDLRSHYSSFSSSTEMVVRNSLQGIRCEGVNTSRLGVMGDVTADMELFLVDGKLVYMAYFPGSRKKAALGTGRDLGVSEVGWDKPEEFFNSIRRSQ